MAEFYSARGWEIPPLPWTNLSPPFSNIRNVTSVQRESDDGFLLLANEMIIVLKLVDYHVIRPGSLQRLCIHIYNGDIKFTNLQTDLLIYIQHMVDVFFHM